MTLAGSYQTKQASDPSAAAAATTGSLLWLATTAAPVLSSVLRGGCSEEHREVSRYHANSAGLEHLAALHLLTRRQNSP